MQRGRGGRDPFFNFGDPFGGFGGFGGFGPPRSLASSFFGGRDPFDDPFFRDPFGSVFQSSVFGPSGSRFADMHPTGFIEHQPPQPKRPRGPIIEELNSDDEKEEQKEGTPRKYGRSSNENFVEEPDDEIEERSNVHSQRRNDYSQHNVAQQQPQTHSFTFSSSTVTYGGGNGAYYTSSKTRRTGSDGVTVEESKEADTATRQAKHRLSRGLHNKGHSVTRKLNSGGKVDTIQTLHNLNEDELVGFEEAWDSKAKNLLPGWTGNVIGHNDVGPSGSVRNQHAYQGGWALPSTQQSEDLGRMPERSGSSRSHHEGRMKNSSDVKGSMGYSRGRLRE